jgi:hypothetical protein
MLRFRFTIIGVLLALSVALVGCGSGPKRNKVSGTVKYKGVPVTAGTITFLTDQGSAAGGAPIKDGVFEIPQATGLASGSYKVTISYPDPKGAGAAAKEGEAPGVGDPAGKQADGIPDPRPVKDLLPAKYNRETELKADIKDGEPNELTFDLK